MPSKGNGQEVQGRGRKESCFYPGSLIAHLLIGLLARSRVCPKSHNLCVAELSVESVSPEQGCLWICVLALGAH